MNYAQNYDIFFQLFIKVVVNKSKAYSFLITGIMHVQKILLSVIMLRFYFLLLSRALEYIISTEVLHCGSITTQETSFPIKCKTGGEVVKLMIQKQECIP